MRKYIILIYIFFPLFGLSQTKLGFQKADSLSYQYYLNGEWNKLITLTNVAFDEGVDSKFMRQRAGYAYFMTGDYTSAGIEYKGAGFDQQDEFTREYLLFCPKFGSNTRFYAGNLS